MAHYAVGFFDPSRSRSPYQFVCKKVYPEGPFALLDTKLRRTSSPEASTVYLFELEDWHSIDPRSQFVTKIIARLSDVRDVIHEALKGAEWEKVIEHGWRKIQIVGKVLKTEYGWFEPRYHSGINAFGPGQDVDPWITFESCPRSAENPYGEALGTSVAQGYLICINPDVIKQAHEAGIAKEGLGELFRKHHGFGSSTQGD